MGKGRSVYEKPGAKVDGIAPRKRRDSKYVKGNGRGTDRETSKGSKKGKCATTLYVNLCTCI
jgi:hypothetical protein